MGNFFARICITGKYHRRTVKEVGGEWSVVSRLTNFKSSGIIEKFKNYQIPENAAVHSSLTTHNLP
jgi:hypothetical protein